MSCVSRYESGPIRDITGAAIRPGGLALTERAIDFCCLSTGARILDVGCGAGASVEYLTDRGFVASGVDISRTLLAEGLDRNPALQLTEACAEALPFAEETQDCILCECVLSLLKEPLQALAEFARVLRPGGHLILSDMYVRGAGMPSSPDCGLGGPVTRGEIGAWLSESGFATLLWEDHTSLVREMAARFVLAGGSAEGFSCATEVGGAVVLPGYYLLVGAKNRTRSVI